MVGRRSGLWDLVGAVNERPDLDDVWQQLISVRLVAQQPTSSMFAQLTVHTYSPNITTNIHKGCTVVSGICGETIQVCVKRLSPLETA